MDEVCDIRTSRAPNCSGSVLLQLPPGLLVRVWPAKRIILGRRTCRLLHQELLHANHILQERSQQIDFDGQVIVISGERQFVDRSLNKKEIKITSSWSNAQPRAHGSSEIPHVELVDSHLTGINLDASSNHDWTIAFAGRALVRPEWDNCIILGPGGKHGNDQLRYEATDSLVLYVSAATFMEIKLPVDPIQFHMLTLTWSRRSRAMWIYQNCDLVATVPTQEEFSLHFLRVAAWFGGRFQSKLAVHRLIKINAAVDQEEVCEMSRAVLQDAEEREGFAGEAPAS